MSKYILQVNSTENQKIQVNVTTQVNSKKIRKITHNGREHWVLPSYTLPADVVMNGGLYPSSEIDAHYESLEGTLAPLGHPTVDGQFVSAFSPEGINVGHVGAFNRNVKKSGNRIYVEKWIDIEVAGRTESGRELLQRIESLDGGEDVPPIHTSVAVFLERLEANEEQKKAGASWVAKIQSMDHDAILLHEVGAATPEQGVGLMVNADLATPLNETEAPSWFLPIYEQFKKFFNPQVSPAVNSKEGDMPLSPEEKAELTADISKNVAANMTEQLTPLTEAIKELQANQKSLSEALTANQKAEEAEKRQAVAAKLGDVVANALQGEALDAAYKQLGDAASLAPNSSQDSSGLSVDVSNLPKE